MVMGNGSNKPFPSVGTAMVTLAGKVYVLLPGNVIAKSKL